MIQVGGVSEIYHVLTGQGPRALKIPKRDHIAEDTPSQLKREKECMRLCGPAVPLVYETPETPDTSDDQPYIYMEYIDGGNFVDLPVWQFLQQNRLEVISRLVATFGHVHSQVMHGDIKPGNMMLSRDGAVKVVDFGAA